MAIGKEDNCRNPGGLFTGTKVGCCVDPRCRGVVEYVKKGGLSRCRVCGATMPSDAFVRVSNMTKRLKDVYKQARRMAGTSTAPAYFVQEVRIARHSELGTWNEDWS